ncbi:glutamine synthetase family protein [Arthrobacter sp. UM1]|uniref:glutamine synthetase family protein n=1 Tax=Arthrobacter sp. UM1 TaxID=2766776 RepID=UPI001CF658E0|nr:glutamine synthetase family protein [Arthrobacter sp. UM1]
MTAPTAAPGMLTEQELRSLVESGEIDTVVVAITDHLGRLQGKRCGARHFLDDVLAHGVEGCNYLLAVDVDNNTVDGYALSSWESGYGDLKMVPDLSTLRRLPWAPGSALVLCDIVTMEDEPIPMSPRQMLRQQLERLEKLGYRANAATELEFILFEDDFDTAQQLHYTDLTPSTQHNVDYSLLATSRIEPVIRDIRVGMEGAGMTVEAAKGECNLGQQEITFRYGPALRTADNHSVYKTGAKEIAAAHGQSLTFMAKFNEREGNSCHVHFSLTDLEGNPVSTGDREHGFSEVMEQMIAGQLACLEEFALFFAPNINSYKRFREGSFAPTAIAWGMDNRSCAVRVVGHGPSLRIEHRVGGGDVNPYTILAAIVAATCHGIENGLELEPMTQGSAYTTDAPRISTTLREARDRFRGAEKAKAAFGEDVVEHYAHAADIEIADFEAAVTDWERSRGFERL